MKRCPQCNNSSKNSLDIGTGCLDCAENTNGDINALADYIEVWKESWEDNLKEIKINTSMIADHYINEFAKYTNRIITYIKVINLFGHYSYKISLKDNSVVSIIIGSNGFGKTTVFKLLESVFVDESDYMNKLKFLLKIPFDEFEIGFNDIDPIILKKHVDDINIKTIEFIYNNEKEPFNIEISEYDKTKIVNSKFKQHYEIISRIYPEANRRFLFINTNRLFGDKINSILSDHCSLKKDYSKLVKKRHKNCDDIIRNYHEVFSDNGYVKRMNLLSDEFSSFFPNNLKKTIDTDYSGNFIIKTNDNLLELTDLSSGELNLLIIIYCIIFRCDNGSIVLIDEPEISLHIVWQQRIVYTIEKLCAKKKCQVIIATHSPFICSNYDDLITEPELLENIE